MSALNGGGAITGIDVKEDGAYITYTLPGGADPVTKKLGSIGTALAEHVLSPYTFSNSEDVEIEGTMTNRGAVSKSITPSGSAQSYTIPAGYHNGSGKVSVSATKVSFHVKVTATAYYNGRTDRIAGYFYYEADVTITGTSVSISNVTNNDWVSYDELIPGSVDQTPKITSIAISNVKYS